jgi:putative redox protein
MQSGTNSNRSVVVLKQNLIQIMKPGMTVTYQGSLRNVAQHLSSGNTLITDAPTDNHGRGEAFSPTDLLCTSLATCMITIMAIAAEGRDLILGEIKAEIVKVMLSDPRRVGEIHINVRVENKGLSENDRKVLEHAALNCPVAKSLSTEIKQNVKFEYFD